MESSLLERVDVVSMLKRCPHLCRSGDRSGSGSHQPQAAAARATTRMTVIQESTSDMTSLVAVMAAHPATGFKLRAC